MTPEQIELIIRAAIGVEAQRYLIVAVVLAIVVPLCAAYFGSYLQSKGNQRAIREDLHNLTMQVSATTKATEEIKAQIGTTTWVQQQRWQLKRELYTDLLLALYRLAHINDHILNLYIAEDKLGHPTLKEHLEETRKRREERETQVEPLWEEVLRVRSFGELTLAKETIGVLDKLHEAWTRDDETYLDFLDGRVAALRKAHREIVTRAKLDMEL